MRIFLAPMEGVIDHHMRSLLVAIGGIDLCVTEFIRVTDHLLPNKVFFRYCPELLTDGATSQGCPVRVQLLGSNPAALAMNAEKAARLGASAIDLNFGCPAKTVNRHRGGACLLEEPDLLEDIAGSVRAAVPDTVPVTAKIRLGYQDRTPYLANAMALTRAGVSELVVHARSKADGYKPPAYWECIGEIREAVSIPVIANGEIWSVDDFLLCRERSGCDDIMLGRGILAQPDLALAIKVCINEKRHLSLSWQQIARHLLDFYQATRHNYPKKYLGNRLKQWLFYLKLQYPQAETLFEKIKKSRDDQVITHALADAANITDKKFTGCAA